MRARRLLCGMYYITTDNQCVGHGSAMSQARFVGALLVVFAQFWKETRADLIAVTHFIDFIADYEAIALQYPNIFYCNDDNKLYDSSADCNEWYKIVPEILDDYNTGNGLCYSGENSIQNEVQSQLFCEKMQTYLNENYNNGCALCSTFDSSSVPVHITSLNWQNPNICIFFASSDPLGYRVIYNDPTSQTEISTLTDLSVDTELTTIKLCVTSNIPTPTRYCFDDDPATTYSTGDMCYDIREIRYITLDGAVPAGFNKMYILDCKVPNAVYNDNNKCILTVGSTQYRLVQKLELWTLIDEESTEFNFCFEDNGGFKTGGTTCLESQTSEIRIDSESYETPCNSPWTDGECKKISGEIATGLLFLNFGHEACMLLIIDGIPRVVAHDQGAQDAAQIGYTFKRLCKAPPTQSPTQSPTTQSPTQLPTQSTTQSTTVAPAPPPKTDGLLTPAQHHVTVAVIGVVVGGTVLYSVFRNK